ncbi:hypothetical protein ACP3WV_22795, partial [Salmonella enterica]|uniref:hypothetical protein n=1 Tax=Salmonella enterica TaxID=28901 RepID=UPI003CED770B
SQNVQDAIDLENQLQDGIGSAVGGATSSLSSAQPYPGTAAALTCYFCQCQADLNVYHRLTRRAINEKIDKSFNSLRSDFILGTLIDDYI